MLVRLLAMVDPEIVSDVPPVAKTPAPSSSAVLPSERSGPPMVLFVMESEPALMLAIPPPSTVAVFEATVEPVMDKAPWER